MRMKTIAALGIVMAMAGTLAACGTTPGERALTGGALGAGTAAGITAAAGGNPVIGALAGAAGGAIIGAATTPTGQTSDHVRWCAERYRSYDPRTDTYMGYDGYRHRCNSPY